jgi:hypothetical protein
MVSSGSMCFGDNKNEATYKRAEAALARWRDLVAKCKLVVRTRGLLCAEPFFFKCDSSEPLPRWVPGFCPQSCASSLGGEIASSISRSFARWRDRVFTQYCRKLPKVSTVDICSTGSWLSPGAIAVIRKQRPFVNRRYRHTRVVPVGPTQAPTTQSISVCSGK